MKKVYSYETQCRGKHQFTSKSRAKRASRQFATVRAGTGILDAYKCPHCDRYHIGHTPGSRT